MKVVLIHYAFAPVPGGVETVMSHHARWMADQGMEVTVLTGRGGPLSGVKVEVIPELSATHPRVSAAQREVGDPGSEAGSHGRENPSALRVELTTLFLDRVSDAEHVFVHNVMTMPFHLALTGALLDCAAQCRTGVTWWNWIHDVARANPDHAWSHGTDPWHQLMDGPFPGFRHIAVSRLRAGQFASASRLPVSDISVIPNGIPPLPSVPPNPALREWTKSKQLDGCFPILFHPARLLPRKGIATSLEILWHLRAEFPRALLAVSGALDPHRPAMAGHAQWLREITASAGLTQSAFFLGEFLDIGPSEISALYEWCDAVVFPSRDEGFGLPVLESAQHGKPCFAPARPPFTEFPGPLSAFFYPVEDKPPAIARFIKENVLADRKVHRDKLRAAAGFVDTHYRWDALLGRYLAPLLLEAPGVV